MSDEKYVPGCPICEEQRAASAPPLPAVDGQKRALAKYDKETGQVTYETVSVPPAVDGQHADRLLRQAACVAHIAKMEGANDPEADADIAALRAGAAAIRRAEKYERTLVEIAYGVCSCSDFGGGGEHFSDCAKMLARASLDAAPAADRTPKEEA